MLPILADQPPRGDWQVNRQRQDCVAEWRQKDEANAQGEREELMSDGGYQARASTSKLPPSSQLC